MSEADLGEPTYTLFPCWMPKPFPPRNECMHCFAPAARPTWSRVRSYCIARFQITKCH